MVWTNAIPGLMALGRGDAELETDESIARLSKFRDDFSIEDRNRMVRKVIDTFQQ